MAPARQLAHVLAAVLAASVGVLNESAVATSVPDIPVRPGAWTTTSRQRGHEKASFDDAHRRLEEQASRETRETFGEDFCQQLENEQQAARASNGERARISREAGCSPASPLSSPSLGSVEVPGNYDETAREGTTQNDVAGPSIGDWLR